MNSTVIAVVAVLCLVGIFAVSRARAQKLRPAEPATYIALRDQALSTSRKALGLPASKAPLVVLMDIGADEGFTITTVAYEDGTASIYLSNGGGFIGGGQRHEAIRNAAYVMLKAAEQTLTNMTAVKAHPLPGAGKTSFYVVTDAGTYLATAATKDIEAGSQHPLYQLYVAGQDVITQYRISQQSK
ncbi:MAG: hypothetical protein QM808_02615 [Steroidobacteraceae bacterium]